MNADWSTDDDGGDPGDVDAIVPACRLADLQATPLRPVTELQQRVLVLLHTHTIRHPYDVRTRYAKRPHIRWRSGPLNYREIGWLLDCSERYVRMVVQDALGRARIRSRKA